MLCGLICGGDKDPVETWLDQILPAEGADHQVLRESRAELRDFARPIENRILGPDLSLALPALEDSDALIERATSVYDWVRGFLYALGVLGISEKTLSREGGEILGDLTAMTRMDLDDLDESEENELALTEVTEFIRVAAMLIHDERAVARERIQSR